MEVGMNTLTPCNNNNNNGQQRYSKPQIFSIKLRQGSPILSLAKEQAQTCHQSMDISTLSTLQELYYMWKANLLIINTH